MMKGQLSRRIFVWGGVAVFATYALYAFFLARANIAFPPPLQIHCVGERASDFSCYKERYRAFTSVLGVRVAFQSMHHAYDTNSYVRSQCHQLTHVIGNTAAEKAKDISDAFVEGDSLCWSGYYHGVVEEYARMRGKEGFQKNANTLCAKIKDKAHYGFDYYNCVHGIGHGVMAITKNQLFEALPLCESLTGDWERRSCYGGVFMENVMTDNRNHYAPYLKPDDLLYPCTAVHTPYKEECYKMQTSYALSKNGYDFAKLFTLCTESDLGYERTCAQSIGRDASGQSVSDQTQTMHWCALAQNDTQQTDCYIGAVKDYVSYFHGDEKARALCFAIPSRFQAECEKALLEQWATIKPRG